MPVYNNEGTLKRAVESVLNQTFEGGYELICVVDPCKDKSAQILLDFAKQYSDKVIVHVEEKRLGQALSRQKYISQANGAYISFMDGDDELDKDYLKVMYETIIRKKADVVSSSFYAIYGENNRKVVYPFRRNVTLTGKKIMSAYLMDASLRGFMWAKIYKKEILLSKPTIGLYVFSDMFEDQALNGAVMAKCKKVVLISKPLYNYYKNIPSSAMTIKRKDRAIKHLAIFALLRRFFEVIDNKDALSAFKSHLWRMRWSWKFDMKLDTKNGANKEYKKEVLATWKAIKNFKKELKIDGESYSELIERGIIS